MTRPWSPVKVKQWSEHDSKKPKDPTREDGKLWGPSQKSTESCETRSFVQFGEKLTTRAHMIEGECPIFRWVEIASIWWETTRTIWLRRTRLEVPMQSLNQFPMVTDLAGARSVWSRRSIPVRNRRTNKNPRRAILISLESGVLNHRGQHIFVCVLV
jgi:hypothetical protein